MNKIRIILIINLLCGSVFDGTAQRYLNSGIRVEVVPDKRIEIYFDRGLREWDGFGVNYVEACQTRDYEKFRQDYSGFSFATEQTRGEILDLIFGEDGLKPGLTKLFLDPFHEGMTKEGNDNDDPMDLNLDSYDHETTTGWMRYFNREGIKRMEAWGGKLQAIVTLYGPAPWMTSQKYVLGRTIDPRENYEVAEYMVSWAKYLREKEHIDVRYISFHNEGDAYYRWPRDGSNPGEDHRDYNSYWPPSQVVDFLKITRVVLDLNQLECVGLSTGETQNWYRFDQWGYATAIIQDEEALGNLELMASHSFTNMDIPNSVYYGDFRSIGQDLVHSKKPEVRVWVTSRPWTTDEVFIDNLRRDIYDCKSNGLIPWALISGANQWLGSDLNYSDGSMKVAFTIKESGDFEVNKGYYYYKQVTRAGQPGMLVAQVVNYDPGLGAIAFADNGSGNSNSYIIINRTDDAKLVSVNISGSSGEGFDAYRTSVTENYAGVGLFVTDDGVISYLCPPHSVTTFFERKLK